MVLIEPSLESRCTIGIMISIINSSTANARERHGTILLLQLLQLVLRLLMLVQVPVLLVLRLLVTSPLLVGGGGEGRRNKRCMRCKHTDGLYLFSFPDIVYYCTVCSIAMPTLHAVHNSFEFPAAQKPRAYILNKPYPSTRPYWFAPPNLLLLI